MHASRDRETHGENRTILPVRWALAGTKLRVYLMRLFHNGPIAALAQLSEPNGTQII